MLQEISEIAATWVLQHESIKMFATLTLQHYPSFQNPCNKDIATITNVET